MSLPLAVELAWCCRPFLWMTRLSTETISTCFQESLLGRFNQRIQFVLSPLRSCSRNQTCLFAVLRYVHQGVALLLLGSLTCASTNVIGLVVMLLSGMLLLRGLLCEIAFKPTILDVGVLGFFLTAVLSTAFSSYQYTSVIGLGKFAIFFLGYLNFRVLAQESFTWFRWACRVLVLLGVGESIIGLYQYVHHVQPLATWQDTSLNPEDQLTRIFGTLQPSNPNLLAGFLIPCLALGSGLSVSQLLSRRFLQGVLWGLLSSLILMALVLTGSRGGYLSIAVMSVLFYFSLGHLLWHEPALKTQAVLKALWIAMLFCAGLMMAGGVMLVPALKTRVLSIFAMREDSSNSYRMNVWISTWRLIQDNWLVGIGPGNDTFKHVYGLYMVSGYNALSAYSIFLEIWAEQGILGLLSFVVLVILSAFRTLLGVYEALFLADKLLLITLWIGMIGSVTYGLFDTIWYRPSVNLLFWLLLAGLSVYSESILSHGKGAVS